MAGVGNPITISSDDFSARKNPKFSTPSGIAIEAYGKTISVTPPKITDSTVDYVLSRNVNPYQEFAFEKLNLPNYGDEKCIARYTGVPVNLPDYVADYHLISLMRLADRYVSPDYSGVVENSTETPEPGE